MTDGLSMVLIQWSELDRKLSEFREIITEEENDMTLTASKKLLSDFQLEWEELDKKTNIILHYEWQYNGVLNDHVLRLVYQIVFEVMIVPIGYHKAILE